MLSLNTSVRKLQEAPVVTERPAQARWIHQEDGTVDDAAVE